MAGRSSRGYNPYKQLRLFSWRKDRWVYTPIPNPHPSLRGLAARPDAVPAAPIIRAFADARAQNRLSLSDVNRAMYAGKDNVLTYQRLRTQKTFTPRTAILFIRALGLDPVDFDL
jgi:hypothetical protein